MDDNISLLHLEKQQREELICRDRFRFLLFMKSLIFRRREVSLLYLFGLHTAVIILAIHSVIAYVQEHNTPNNRIQGDQSSYTSEEITLIQSDIIPGPIEHIITTERQHGSRMQSEYTGFPTTKNNNAWEDLISPLLFNATSDELLSSGEPIDDSVRVATGGYLASLGVYHELHCLRRIRLWLHREFYYPNATRDDELFMQVHLGHCIEVLRLSAMCNADLGLYSFFWESQDATKPQARSSAPRECKAWSQIDSWSRKRMINNTGIMLLKNE